MIRITGECSWNAPVFFAYEKLKTLDADLEIELRQDGAVEEQGYRISADSRMVRVSFKDGAGAMYALLDIYDALRKGERLESAQVRPYIKKRGLKFNIPLDARTPSYSDASTSAGKNILNMWDFGFWTAFLDRMAENKYNVLSLWSLCPFPSMVRIPEFPELYLDDVKATAHTFQAELSGKNIYDEDHRKNLYTLKKIGIDEKILFWQAVMEYAKDRCIDIYLFTWNVFAYGTEDTAYGITDDPDNAVTRRYIYCGTKALIETYPLLAGLGVTAGENLTFNGEDEGNTAFEKTDVGFIADTYGKACADYLKVHPERDFTFIHRMQMARYDRIMEAYEAYPGRFEISFKYSQAHMYSSTAPRFIGDFLKEKDPAVKIWLTVRNDDYYMMRWGSPDFAREYLQNMPVSSMSGFYMGADGFTWGRDYMTAGAEEHPLFIDKMWYMFKIWGQLSYNPRLKKEYFVQEIRHHFAISQHQAEHLYSAWDEASRIIPEFNCIHWHDYDFQWYPEGCCMYLHKPVGKLVFANIHEFEECGAIPFSDYLSVKEYARAKMDGEKIRGIAPAQMIRSVRSHAEAALAQLPYISGSGQEELERTIADIRDMSILGQYYAQKEEAAVLLALYHLSGEKALQKKAVCLLREAVLYWKRYSGSIRSRYVPQVLTRLCGKVDVSDFDELAETDVMLAEE